MEKAENTRGRQWIIKGFFYCTILLSALLCLSGCTAASKVVSDDKIKSDLLSALIAGIATEGEEFNYNSQLSSKYEYEFNDFEIEKRQTSFENKTDKVYVNATLYSTNDVIKYFGSFVAYYTLYNEGWILDEITVENFGYAPLQSAEFTTEQLADALDHLNYKNAANIDVTNREEDLENRCMHYYLTATCQYTYVTEHIDVMLTFLFPEDGWSTSDAYISEAHVSESNWHIAGKFGYPTHRRTDLILGIEGAIDTLRVKCIDRYSGSSEVESDIHIYKTSNTSLKQVMGDFYKEVGWGDIAEYMNYYNFPIIMLGECTDYNSFEYVAWWNGSGSFDFVLFIGRDKLGYLYQNDVEIDKFNRRVIVKTIELKPVD